LLRNAQTAGCLTRRKCVEQRIDVAIVDVAAAPAIVALRSPYEQYRRDHALAHREWIPMSGVSF